MLLLATKRMLWTNCSKQNVPTKQLAMTTTSQKCSAGSASYKCLNSRSRGPLVSIALLRTRRLGSLACVLLVALLAKPVLGQNASIAAEKQAVEDANRESARGTTESRKAALVKYQEALSLARTLGDKQEEARVLYAIGSVYYYLDQMNNTIDFYSQALAIRKAIADNRGQAQALTAIGIVLVDLEQYEKAIGSYHEAL